ncbi:hypothetical protein CGCF413_v010402 [Colletotrichum fructicola]|nr:hypothetical protein CGCF413_v010402 [Colletotrichum fructicola]
MEQAPQALNRFRDHWKTSTADDNVTLYGFRRFKTTHLLNLRFLENEIAELDHIIYQAGLSLEFSPTERDRLGLKHSRRDQDLLNPLAAIDNELVKKLRGLLQQYDEALQAFNTFGVVESASRFIAEAGNRTGLNGA